MSKVGSVYSRISGDDRCAVEATTGLGTIVSATMDAEFNDFSGAMNQVLWRDGSAAMTGDFDINANQLLNIGTVTGTPIFTGNATVNGTFLVQGNATFNGVSELFNGVSIIGLMSHAGNYTLSGDLELIGNQTATGDVTVDGTIINDLMPTNGTWTPTLYGSTTPGTFVFSQQDGTYTVIGDDVFITVHIAGYWDVAPVGDIRIGIDHTIATGKNFVIKDVKHVDVDSDSNILAMASSTQSYLTLHTYSTNGAVNNITAADQVSVLNELIIQGRYIKA